MPPPPPPSLYNKMLLYCFSEFEANLEEVWSVRKNIHHNQNSQAPNALSSNFKNPISSSLSVPKSYSRHGAVNTHQQEASHGIPLNINSGESLIMFSCKQFYYVIMHVSLCTCTTCTLLIIHSSYSLILHYHQSHSFLVNLIVHNKDKNYVHFIFFTQ